MNKLSTCLLMVGAVLVQTVFAQNDLPARSEAERSFQAAAALQNRSQFALAIPQWEKVLVTTDNPQHLRAARQQLVNCYFQVKQYHQTITLAEAVLNENPAKEDRVIKQLRLQMQVLLAASHLRLGQQDDAEGCLTRLRNEFPHAVEGAKLLGTQGSTPAAPAAAEVEAPVD